MGYVCMKWMDLGQSIGCSVHEGSSLLYLFLESRLFVLLGSVGLDELPFIPLSRETLLLCFNIPSSKSKQLLIMQTQSSLMCSAPCISLKDSPLICNHNISPQPCHLKWKNMCSRAIPSPSFLPQVFTKNIQIPHEPNHHIPRRNDVMPNKPSNNPNHNHPQLLYASSHSRITYTRSFIHGLHEFSFHS